MQKLTMPLQIYRDRTLFGDFGITTPSKLLGFSQANVLSKKPLAISVEYFVRRVLALLAAVSIGAIGIPLGFSAKILHLKNF